MSGDRKTQLAFCEHVNLYNEICLCINRNARPNNNQLYSYYVSLLIPNRIPTIPVNTTYNKRLSHSIAARVADPLNRNYVDISKLHPAEKKFFFRVFISIGAAFI